MPRRKFQRKAKIPTLARTCSSTATTECFASQTLNQAFKRKNLKNYNRLLNNCAKHKQLDLATALFSQLKDQNLSPNLFTYSALLNCCSRCGDLSTIPNILDDMSRRSLSPNNVIYTTIIKGFAEFDLDKALEYFEQMKRSGILANQRTYNTLLRGCSRDGREDIALRLFDEITEPDKVCYDCMINTLVQSGNLQRSLEFYQMAKKNNFGISELACTRLSITCALFDDLKNASIVLGDLKEDVLTPDTLESLKNIITEKKSPKSQEAKLGIRRSPFVLFPPHKKLRFEDYFDNSLPIHLEICSGSGDWIVEKAKNSVDTANWVALELRFDRTFDIWTKILLNSVPNVIILSGDAKAILSSCIPRSSVDAVYINFPPPPLGNSWKLIDKSLISDVNNSLKVDGCITILTDDGQYCQTIVSDLESVGLESCHSPLPYLLNDFPRYGSSWFDELWKQRGRKDRFFLKYRKGALRKRVLQPQNGIQETEKKKRKTKKTT